MRELSNKQKAKQLLSRFDCFIRKVPIIGWIHSRFDEQQFNQWFPTFQAVSIAVLMLWFLIKLALS